MVPLGDEPRLGHVNQGGKRPPSQPGRPDAGCQLRGLVAEPEPGVTKEGLAEFYGEIAEWILPHLVGRPLSLLRCPEGVSAQCFFQKHAWAGLSDAAGRGRDCQADQQNRAHDS